jgi:hypothetical protein
VAIGRSQRTTICLSVTSHTILVMVTPSSDSASFVRFQHASVETHERFKVPRGDVCCRQRRCPLGTRSLRNVFEKLPFEQRITHRGTHGFPGATFDYFFTKNVAMGKPIITQTNASDHLPVTCDVTIQ